jgi:hypothetical protein
MAGICWGRRDAVAVRTAASGVLEETEGLMARYTLAVLLRGS